MQSELGALAHMWSWLPLLLKTGSQPLPTHACPRPYPTSTAVTVHHPPQQGPGCEDGEGWELWPPKAMSQGQTFYTFPTQVPSMSQYQGLRFLGDACLPKTGTLERHVCLSWPDPTAGWSTGLSHLWQEGQSHSPSGQMLRSACSSPQDLKGQCEFALGPSISWCLGVLLPSSMPEGSFPPPCDSLKSGLNY